MSRIQAINFIGNDAYTVLNGCELKYSKNDVLKVIMKNTTDVSCIALDKASMRVFLGYYYGSIRVCVNNSSKRLNAHTGRVLALAITSDSNLMISSGEDSLKVWDLNTLECIKTIDTKSMPEVLVSNDPNHVWGASTHDGTVCKWNLKTGQCEKTLKILDYASEVAISSDCTLAVVSRLNYLRVLNLETGETTELDGHDDSIRTVAICSRYAVSASEDNVLRTWNIDTGECFYSQKVYEQLRDMTSRYITAISISPDMNTFVTGNANGEIQEWENPRK
jgi:WD40 repeat protein